MLGYTYDGSFDGLLTCIYEAYYRKENPSFIMDMKKYTLSISNTLFSLLDPLDSPQYIKTDTSKSAKVYDAISNKISSEALEIIYNVFLSETKDAEVKILNYIRLGFKIGFDVNKHLQDERVLGMIKLDNKVTKECHNMLGFIRFELINDFYYAAFEPDHNITELITPHFVERFSDQKFVIHDVKREIASFYNTREWYLTELKANELASISDHKNTEQYARLWREYFISTSIQERNNPRCQKNHMPVRYWKHLTETHD